MDLAKLGKRLDDHNILYHFSKYLSHMMHATVKPPHPHPHPCHLETVKHSFWNHYKKGKRKVQGVPQSQTAALPRPQEEEETDKSKQAQTEQTYEKYYKSAQC